MTSLVRPRPIQVDVTPRPPPGPAAPDSALWAAYFEHLYRQAGGHAEMVPWADGAPNPFMVAWLNAHASSRVRPGARIAVVGCGLGDDVSELASRGYDPVGFDVSPTAIAWARQRHADLAERFITADVLAPPAALLRRFDLVIEVYTIQSLHPALRGAAAAGVAALARPHGVVLAIARGRDESCPLDPRDGPPFALTRAELCSLFDAAQLRPCLPVEEFDDDDHKPPVKRLRAAFSR